jgi:hypothetical protein
MAARARVLHLSVDERGAQGTAVVQSPPYRDDKRGTTLDLPPGPLVGQ